MGNMRAAFESVPYAIAILCICLFIATLFGVNYQFGSIFSLGGLTAFAFVVFGLTFK